MKTLEQFYTIHRQDGWTDDNRPWLVCCNEAFDADKHDSYTRFSGWNCPNQLGELKNPNGSNKIILMKIDSF